MAGSVSAAFQNLASTSNEESDIGEGIKSMDKDSEPAKSAARAKETSVKRKLLDIDDDAAFDLENIQRDREDIPAYYVSSSKRRENKKSKMENMKTAMDSRTEMMKDFTDNFSSFVKKKNEMHDARNASDNIDLWAKRLAQNVREVDIKIRARFMHHIDGLVIDAAEGDWFP